MNATQAQSDHGITPLDLTELKRKVCADQTIRRQLVHRHSVSEVFVTDLMQVSDDHYLAAAHLPRTHSVFNEWQPTMVDPMLCLEIARQASIAVTHGHMGVPLDYQFIFRNMDLTVVDFQALSLGPTPMTGLLDIRTKHLRRGADAPSIVKLDVSFEINGRKAFAIKGSLACLPSASYRQMRHDDLDRLRRERAAAETGRRQICHAAAPALVMRHNPSNVVITAPHGSPAEHMRAALVVDQDHPYFFEHAQDHIPGMLLIESIRQMAVASTASVKGIDAARVLLREFNTKFSVFAELGEPTTLTAEIADETETGLRWGIELSQHGRLLATGAVEAVIA